MATRTALDTARAARLFHALSDETRVSILECLRSCERCVCELTDSLEAAQSRLSFHLRVLKEAGLVSDRREGRWMYYTVNPEALQEAAELIARLATPAVDEGSGCC
jgi:ArsR family transcriptional regulator